MSTFNYSDYQKIAAQEQAQSNSSGTKVGFFKLTNDGDIAVVIRQNKGFPERPIIQITRDKFGLPVNDDKIIDLVKVNNIFIDSVLE